MTWSELKELVRTYVDALRSSDMKKGDVVAGRLPSGKQWAPAQLMDDEVNADDCMFSDRKQLCPIARIVVGDCGDGWHIFFFRSGYRGDGTSLETDRSVWEIAQMSAFKVC